MNNKISKLHKGYTLPEMIIYVVLISIISLVIVNTIISFSSSYRSVRVLQILDQSSISAMERMTRDIRDATTVDVASVLDVSPGELQITATRNAVSTTTRFYVEENVLKMDINGVYSGPLTRLGSSVAFLTFKLLQSSTTDAVKIDMTLQATSSDVTRSKNYHSTIILKGS